MIDKPKAQLLAALLTAVLALSQSAVAGEFVREQRSASAAFPAPQGCERVMAPVPPLRTAPPAATAFLPTQLEVRTPFEPTAVPSGGRNYLVYELHLRNYAGEPLDLQGLEVIAGDGTGDRLATFGADQLISLSFPRGHELSNDELVQSRQLAVGQGTVAYLCLAFEVGVAVPATLRHRVIMADAYADGPSIATRQTKMQVLAPPVEGADWIATGGPGNTSHHRVGLLVMGGNARISRRYAIDWKKVREGSTFTGDPIEAQSHLAYGQPVFAVADSLVVAAADGFPDNIPRTSKGFETALPVTMETIAGNTITLDVGNGQYALYAHLAPGSVQVKAGDRVKRGEFLGRIGNSGDSREPHLHFEVTDSPNLLAGEGLPYLIDHYEIRSQDGSLDARASELPVLEMPINFRPAGATSN